MWCYRCASGACASGTALMLLVMMCLLGAPRLLVEGLATLLVLARLLHLYSILLFEPVQRRHVLRPLAMMGTMAVLITAALFLLWQWLRLYL
jgi:uncharacterized membrane protein YecN with MAPEG domain